MQSRRSCPECSKICAPPNTAGWSQKPVEELTAADFSTGAIVANNNIRIQMFPIDVRSHVRSLKLLATVRLAKSSYWLWFIDLQLLIVLSLSSTHLAASAGILVAMPTKNLEMQAGISGTRWCCGNCQKEVKKLILTACRFKI